ncbi:MAG: DUF4344 domain-containing metallopeptidase [Pseudomonadota bacterium]
MGDHRVDLNQIFGLEEGLAVTVELCGEANAFYDLDERTITMCAEYEDWFADLYDRVQ